MSYVILMTLPKELKVVGYRQLRREEFYSWIWSHDLGLQGIDQGTILSEEAATMGLETDSWTVDSGEAPRERDWVGSQDIESVRLYFETEKQAKFASQKVFLEFGLKADLIEFQKDEDWDAKWKASYTGILVPPLFEIRPPWYEVSHSNYTVLRLNPGAGFGTGTHETTQLCLEALADVGSLSNKSVLDFGSGSGILGIAAHLLGAKSVIGVEIDPLAIDNASHNALINGIKSDQIAFTSKIPKNSKYDLIFANILRPVLIEFSPILSGLLNPRGILIMSGLIDSDLSQVAQVYDISILSVQKKEILSKNEWRAVVYRT